MKPFAVSEEQVLYFRARRLHLAGPGADTPALAANALLGAQAQQLPPALWALSARTRGRPTAAALESQLFTAPRQLVRTWGQRDTLFIFDPVDWATVIAARGTWSAPTGRRGPMPSEAEVDLAGRVAAESLAGVTRSEIEPIVPAAYVREVEAKAAEASQPALRFAAGRLLWRLAVRGDACSGDKRGAEQSFAARSVWFPGLDWTAASTDPAAAAAQLTLRYLASYGPATAADVAHFFTAKVTDARQWLASLEQRGLVASVACGERKRLWARTADLTDLAVPPPRGVAEWPVRLLPLFDAMLMAHADKSWLVPDANERPLIWRKAAYVAATIHVRGRIVATWDQAIVRKRLVVTVTPLANWRAPYLAGARREAEAVAAHLGVGEAEVTVGAP